MIYIDRKLPCGEYCQKLSSTMEMTQYTGDDPRWNPALILLDKYTIEEYIAKIHSNKRYGYRKAQRLGYKIEPFNIKTFIPDMFEIDNSKPIRSGGRMYGGYLKTIKERGGYPQEYYPAPSPLCQKHFRQLWGCFIPQIGYKQGRIVTNKKLVAYISLVVIGELAIYSRILGHGEYLKDDIMSLLHIETLKYLKDSVLYIMYGDMASEQVEQAKGLYDWKRWFLFEIQQIKWKWPYFVKITYQQKACKIN